jgi:hypothetical protein
MFRYVITCTPLGPSARVNTTRHTVLATDNCIADVEATGVIVDSREFTGSLSLIFLLYYKHINRWRGERMYATHIPTHLFQSTSCLLLSHCVYFYLSYSLELPSHTLGHAQPLVARHNIH